jgi:uncharacterized protein
MREVVEVLVCALVDRPDEVEVVEVGRRGNTVQIDVRVGEGEMGRVIGRQGRVANAIRAVANTAAARENLRASVEFNAQ